MLGEGSSPASCEDSVHGSGSGGGSHHHHPLHAQGPRGVKRSVTAAEGVERRQRQLRSIRSRMHGEVLKHLRLEEEEGEGEGETHADPTVPTTSSPSDVAVCPQPLNNSSTSSTHPPTNGSGRSHSPPVDVQALWVVHTGTKPSTVSVALLPPAAQLLLGPTSTRAEIYQGLLVVRKLLTRPRHRPCQAVLQAALVPRLVALLQQTEDPELQLEAAWAVTNFCGESVDFMRAVVASGGVQPLVQLLWSPVEQCRSQAVWALGNLCGEAADVRDAVLHGGAVEGLLPLLMRPEASVSLQRNVTWCLCNMCRTTPRPPAESLRPVLQLFVSLMVPDTDHLVVADMLWGISYLCDNSARQVQCVLECGVLPHVLGYVAMVDTMLLAVPALRIVGNFAAGTPEQTEVLLRAGVLGALKTLLGRCTFKSVLQESCWALSNIVGESASRVQMFLDLQLYTDILRCAASPLVAIAGEAVLCLTNSICVGSEQQLQLLVGMGVVPVLCDFLRRGRPLHLVSILDALTLLLEVGEYHGLRRRSHPTASAAPWHSNEVAAAVERAGGLAILEELQQHTEQRVYNGAASILETYFDTEEMSPVELSTPNMLSTTQGDVSPEPNNANEEEAAAPAHGYDGPFSF